MVLFHDIANRASVSTYILQVTENHLTSTNLNMAKHIFDLGPTQVKALVWFWLIDETLSANLVYQSDHEIGSTFEVMEQVVKIMMMV